eukprot:g3198.t1
MSTDSYYDLDAILGEEQRVPTTFKVSAAQLGHFMPGNEVQQIEDLPKDTRLELPLWLSKILLERNMVALDMPPFYGSRNRSRLKADEWSINIRDKSPYYFRVGRTLSKIKNDVELLDLMQKICASRHKEILDRSQNSLNEDMTNFKRNLSDMEMNSFKAGYDAANDFFRWKNGESGILRASSLLRSRRPRLAD